MFILYQSFNLIPLFWNSNEPKMNRPKKNPRFLEKSSDLMRFLFDGGWGFPAFFQMFPPFSRGVKRYSTLTTSKMKNYFWPTG